MLQIGLLVCRRRAYTQPFSLSLSLPLSLSVCVSPCVFFSLGVYLSAPAHTSDSQKHIEHRSVAVHYAREGASGICIVYSKAEQENQDAKRTVSAFET